MLRAVLGVLVIWMGVGGPLGCAAPAPPPPPLPPLAAGDTLILVGIDALRPDDLGRGHTPTLDDLARRGARAAALIPSMPTLTFPSFYTLVTGLEPDHHGVVNNTMTDARRPGVQFSLGSDAQVGDAFWWDQGEPIWVTAQRAGLPTATMFWPGSEAPIRGVRPASWRAFDKNVTYAQRVDQVLWWLDAPPPSRPRLVTLYFEGVDSAGHRAGPGTPEVDQALADVDAALGRLLGALAARGTLSRTDVVVVSDHGMAGLSEERVLYLDDYADPQSFDVEAGGAFAFIRPRPGREDEVARALVGPHANFTGWRKADFPARFAYGRNERVAPIGCLADVGWTITTREAEERRRRRRADGTVGRPMRGTHGFDNQSPEMAAVLVAMGPGIAPGARLSEVRAVDVHGLLLRLLAIPGPPGDGDDRRIAPMLRAGAAQDDVGAVR